MYTQRTSACQVWSAGAKRLRLVAILLLFLLVPVVLWSAPGESKRPIDVLELESQVFGNKRKIRVLLPEDYADPANQSRHYPALYLNDGQNLFDASTALFGTEEWQVDETVRRMVAAGEIPPLIVIGIDNAGRQDRAYEYLPYPDEFLDPPVPEPAGSMYPDFLELEVIPFIESRYRVKVDAGSRMLGGSSYGALIALHTAISRPGLFSGLLLESPSFYVDENHVLKDAQAANLKLDRVYLGVGTNELALDGCPEHPGNREAVSGVRVLAAILGNKGIDEGPVLVNIEECAEHTESDWARRFPVALEHLYGGL